jgi:hypothetical protein
LDFLVTRGSEHELWAETTYKSLDDVYRCFAYKSLDNGRLVRMAQGFGSGCQGLGGELSETNGLRTLSLSKLDRGLAQCHFPSWVSSNKKAWKIIPRGGMRSLPQANIGPQPSQVFFPDTTSFILGSEVNTINGQLCAALCSSVQLCSARCSCVQL